MYVDAEKKVDPYSLTLMHRNLIWLLIQLKTTKFSSIKNLTSHRQNKKLLSELLNLPTEFLAHLWKTRGCLWMNDLNVFDARDAWRFTGYFSHQNNLLRLHHADLRHQIGQARLDFISVRQAVLGGAVLNDVGYEEVLTFETILR